MTDVFKINTYSFSHFPENKLENEDCILIKNDYYKIWNAIFAIADGVGGHKGGKVASEIACATLENFIPDSQNTIKNSYNIIYETIKNESLKSLELEKMATTLTSCFIKNDRVYVAHVGDTRVYHLRNEGIMKRTIDQTEVQKLIDDGVISRARAASYPRKNVLLSALSAKGIYEIYENEFSVKHNDRIIMMTDGAYHNVKMKELTALSLHNKDLNIFGKSVLQLIKDRKPHDDYSGIFLEVE